MIGTDTSRDDLIKELEALRQQVAELEKLEKHKQAKPLMPDNETLSSLLAENATDVIWKVNVLRVI